MGPARAHVTALGRFPMSNGTMAAVITFPTSSATIILQESNCCPFHPIGYPVIPALSLDGRAYYDDMERTYLGKRADDPMGTFNVPHWIRYWVCHACVYELIRSSRPTSSCKAKREWNRV
ncbi:hypothetical protein LY76DRAFT_589151, partial [Colletotrichum caudatum]